MFKQQNSAMEFKSDAQESLSDADLDTVSGGSLGFATGIPVSTYNPVSKGGTGFSTFNVTPPKATLPSFHGNTGPAPQS